MWALLDRWVGRVATAIGFLALARLLSPDELSRTVWVTFGAALTGLITESGICALLINSTDNRDVRIARVAADVVSAVLAVLFLGIGGVYFASGDGSQGLALVLVAVGTLLIPVNAVPLALLMRTLQYRKLAIRRSVSQLVGAAAAVGSAALGVGASAVGLQYVTASCVSAVMLRRSTRYQGGLLVPATAKAVLSYLRRALAVTGSALIPFLTLQAFVLCLPILSDRSRAGQVVLSMNLFGVAADLVGTAIGATMWPILARLRAQQVPTARLLQASSTAMLLSAVTTVVALGLILLGYGPVLGTTWQPGMVLLWLLVATLPANAWVQMDRARLLSAGLLRKELAQTTLAAPLTVLPALVLGSGGSLVLLGVAFQGRAAVMVLVRLLSGAVPTGPEISRRWGYVSLMGMPLVWLGIPLVQYGTGVPMALAGGALVAASASWATHSNVVQAFHRLSGT